MVMKTHGQFTREILDRSHNDLVGVQDVILLSNLGVTPEAWNMEDPLPLPTMGQASTMSASLILPPFIVPPVDSGFKFGASSEKELIGVIPPLVQCARLALKLSTQDFTIYDGIRSLIEQRHYISIGTSQTMDSQHLPQADGFGHALDAVPFINGKPTWDWEGCYRVALAFDQAATQLGIAEHIRWGAAWDKRLSDYGGTVETYKKATQDYCARHPGKDFIDGPHFEWRA